MVTYLRLFRLLTLVLMVLALFGRQRKTVLFGFAWFWIGMIPALPLVAHFLRYYVFLPVVGLSLAVGVVFASLYDWLRRFQPLLSSTAIILTFGGVLYVTSRGIRNNIRNNSLLGISSRIASNTLNDLKGFHSTLPAGATLYFMDAKEPLGWQHDFGGLVKMAYRTDQISTLYQSRGDSVYPDTRDLIVLGVANGRLLDETERFLSDPTVIMKFVESDLRIDLSRHEVIAGKDKYELRIEGLSKTEVLIAYTVNDGPLEIFSTWLDAESKVAFEVSRGTPKGMYKFWAFKVSNSNDWVRTKQALTVR